MHSADDLAALGVAFVGDRAGVDHAQIRMFFFFGFTVTGAQQAFTDQLRFILVDFATESYCLDGCHSGCHGCQLERTRPANVPFEEGTVLGRRKVTQRRSFRKESNLAQASERPKSIFQSPGTGSIVARMEPSHLGIWRSMPKA